MNATQTTTVKGFITEADTEAVENTFGTEVADRLRNAPEGTTFLSLLFEGFADKK